MTNEEILKKAIEKAVANGYSVTYKGFYHGEGDESALAKSLIDIDEVFNVIFSHDFAKAFWKGELAHRIYEEIPAYPNDINPNVTPASTAITKLEGWEWHLALLSKEVEPLKYLEKFL